MNQIKHGNRYNDDFKKMLVDLYRFGSSVKELNSEYGVSEVTIYKWIKDFTPVEGVDGKEVTPKEIHARRGSMSSLHEYIVIYFDAQ